MRASTVAEQFGIDKGAISRQVQHLVDLGLLDRTPDPADGRATLRLGERRSAGRLEDVNRTPPPVTSTSCSATGPTSDLASFVDLLARYNTSLGR